MALQIEDLPADLLAANLRGDLVLLVGAGFSKQAVASVPSWRELLAQLLTFSVNEGYLPPGDREEVEQLLEDGEYLMVAEELKTRLPSNEYIQFMEDRFSVSPSGVSEAHSLLWDLQPALVMTTNYDRLLEDSYAAKHHLAATVFVYSEPDALQRKIQSGSLNTQPPNIFKLHGSIDRPDDLILSELDYRRLLYRQPGYRKVLSALFITKVILMIGFSADDPELLRLLEANRDALKDQAGSDYALLPKGNSVKEKRLQHDFGLRVIPYEPDEDHSAVREFLELLVTHRTLEGAD